MSNDIQSITPLMNTWLRKPDWAEPLQSELRQSISIIQYMGLGQLTEDNTETPQKIAYDFYNKTKAEEFELLTFFAARMGRHGCFWMPSWINNFNITKDMLSTDVTIQLQNDNFNEIYQGYERVALILSSGDIITRKITGVTVVSAAREDITLSAALGRDILMAEVDCCCLFLLVRMENDSLDLSYNTDSISKTQINVYELVKEYP